MLCPFTQSQIWSKLNKLFNNLDPEIIESDGIFCLFGYDAKNASWTSYNGPFVPSNTSMEVLNRYVDTVLKKSKEKGIVQINFRSLDPLRENKSQLEIILKKSGFSRIEYKTALIDLTLPEDVLLKNFEHAARKGIKKAQSMNILIEKCTDFEMYFEKFLIPYCLIKKIEMKEKNIYKMAWDLDTQNIYNYWIASSSLGETLGFLGSYVYENSIATEILSALTPLAFEKKIPAQDLLHWEIIKYHKAVGTQYFDVGGFNPNPILEKEKNIKRFKEKWGGKIYDVSSYSLDRSSFLRKLIRKIRCKLYG